MNQFKIKKVKGGLTMFNKKGVSAIIATVLLILITIATVTIVWTVVVPMIQNNLGQAESFTDCIYATEQFQVLENACYSLSKNEAGKSKITLHIPVKLGGKDFNFYGISTSLKLNSFRNNFESDTKGEETFSKKITNPEDLPPLGSIKTILVDHDLLRIVTVSMKSEFVDEVSDVVVSLTVLTKRGDKEESSCGDTTKAITLPACPAV